MLQWAVAPEHLWSQSLDKTWATFPLTDPNCQGAVSCQTWLRVSLLGENEGHRFLSLTPLSSFSFLFVFCHWRFIPPPRRGGERRLAIPTGTIGSGYVFPLFLQRAKEWTSPCCNIRATDGRRWVKRLRFHPRAHLHYHQLHKKRHFPTACVTCWLYMEKKNSRTTTIFAQLKSVFPPVLNWYFQTFA